MSFPVIVPEAAYGRHLRFGNFSPDSYVSTISVTNEDYNVPSLSLSVPVSGVSVPVENVSVPGETASVPPQDFSVPEGDSNPNLPKDVDRLILSFGRRSNDAQKVIDKVEDFLRVKNLPEEKREAIMHELSNVFKNQDLYTPKNGESKLKKVYAILHKDILKQHKIRVFFLILKCHNPLKILGFMALYACTFSLYVL